LFIIVPKLLDFKYINFDLGNSTPSSLADSLKQPKLSRFSYLVLIPVT
jgi:hypothetical protein